MMSPPTVIRYWGIWMMNGHHLGSFKLQVSFFYLLFLKYSYLIDILRYHTCVDDEELWVG